VIPARPTQSSGFSPPVRTRAGSGNSSVGDNPVPPLGPPRAWLLLGWLAGALPSDEVTLTSDEEPLRRLDPASLFPALQVVARKG